MASPIWVKLHMKIYSDTHVHCYEFEKIDKLLNYAHRNLSKHARAADTNDHQFVLFFTDGNHDKTWHRLCEAIQQNKTTGDWVCHFIDDENLIEWQQKLRPYIPEEAQEYFIENNKETNLNFPVHQYPEKPKSLNLVKEQTYSGKLVGIKGQYLIFEDQTVFNVRANEGLVVNVKIY